MARVTVEDCLERVDNRFALIHLAAKRVRQLRKGVEPLVACKNKDVVVALREIAAGKVSQVADQDKNHLLESGEGRLVKDLPDQADRASLSEEQGDLEVMPEAK